MKSNKVKESYVAFLRGINVGGHHKVPMADLKNELQKLEFEYVITLLNSGNIIFDSNSESIENLEKKVSVHLEKSFGFTIPTIIRKAEVIHDLWVNNPFKEIMLTNDIRLYVSFLRQDGTTQLKLPWKSSDNSYQIIGSMDKIMFSVLDLSISQTPKAMDILEKYFGKDITTRSWNTIDRIGKKLKPPANHG